MQLCAKTVFPVTARYRKGPLSQRTAIANGSYCHVMYKLLYPSIRARTAPPVSVRVSVSFSVAHTVLHVRIIAIADLCDSGPESFFPCKLRIQAKKRRISIWKWLNGRGRWPKMTYLCLIYIFSSDVLYSLPNDRAHRHSAAIATNSNLPN